MIRLAISIILTFVLMHSYATIYQSVDGEGNAVFTDKPVKNSKALPYATGYVTASNSEHAVTPSVSQSEEAAFQKQAEALLKKRGEFIERIKKLEADMESTLMELKAAKDADKPTDEIEAKLKTQKAELDELIQEMEDSINDLVAQQKKLMQSKMREAEQ